MTTFKTDKHSPENDISLAPIILDRSAHPISRKLIDQDALKVLYRLHHHGFLAYLVGGAVRDLLLGRKPADFDVVTNARPNQVKKLFKNAFLIGRRFRLAHVRFAGGKIIEVSTFRREPDLEHQAEGIEPGQEDKTPPEETTRKLMPKRVVAFGTPREDALRRDITINALFYDIANFAVYDFVGGLEDLALGRIRIIGCPEERYDEDPVRIWRVLRHAARLNFSIEEKTAAAISEHIEKIKNCAGARLYEELNKDLKSGSLVDFLKLARRFGLLAPVLGEIGKGYQDNDIIFARLTTLFQTIDLACLKKNLLSNNLCFSILFWPWAENILNRATGDKLKTLHDSYHQAKPALFIPRSLLLSVFETFLIVDRLIKAMNNGRMKWSLKKRPQYENAVTLFSIISQGELPLSTADFEEKFHKKFPSGPTFRKKRRHKPHPYHKY